MAAQMHPELGINHVIFVIKVSERCNLACTYCYFFFDNDKSYLKHPPFIKTDQITHILEFIKQAVADYHLKGVTITLHGGEPLLLKKAYFAEICQRFTQTLTPLCTLRLVVQTNAALIDEEWVAIFEKHQVDVGLSVDGTKAIHDRYRKDHHGQGSYQAMRRGLALLRHAKAGGRPIFYSCLAVIDPAASGREAYRHLVDELGFEAISFILPHITHDQVTPGHVDGVTDFLLDVFEEWTRDNNRRIRIRLFRHIFAFFVAQDHQESRYAEHLCNQKGVITLTSNGDITPNDILKPLDPRYQDTGLNCAQHHFRDLVTHPVWQELDAAARTLPAKCVSCRWRRLCRGGDLVQRHSHQSGFERETVYCNGLKRLFSAVEAYLVAGGIHPTQLDNRLGVADVAQPV